MGMMLAAVLLSVGASSGVSVVLSKRLAPAGAVSPGEQAGAGQGDEHPVPPPAPATYLALDPAFVVNLEDPEVPHFLQAEIQVMGRDAALLEGVKTHLPRIRSSLLMLLGQQKPADLVSRPDKEKLQAAVLAEVQKVMVEETGKPVVEGVYFTSFVMQ